MENFKDLPQGYADFLKLNWDQVALYYLNLADRKLSEESLDQWLKDWTKIHDLVIETYNQLQVAVARDTTDEDLEVKLQSYMTGILTPSESREQILKEKLLRSKLIPENFQTSWKKLRVESELYRDKNLPLMTEETKFSNKYDKIIGAQTVQWEDKEITLTQLKPVFQDQDRTMREKAYRMMSERRLADREAINNVWIELLKIRFEMAKNAEYPDYLSYRWREMSRFDYGPHDCREFHQAIADVAVPAASRLCEKRQKRLGLDSLKPWDFEVDPRGRKPLRPFKDTKVLIQKTGRIFQKIDPQLAEYFDKMRKADVLDLDNRKGKAPGGFCTYFQASGIPFIFMNAVGLHKNVQTLFHECGHCFHLFEMLQWPYFHQKDIGAEFAEVASMTMEFLYAPYLSKAKGGFYSDEDAVRARVEHLEDIILYWSRFAVIDSFQHWIYTHPKEALNPDNCDAVYMQLTEKYMPYEDWNGLEETCKSMWHQVVHIFQWPFYCIEYGLAEVGALQVWRNAMDDPKEALRQYRYALSLGNTKSLPELFKAAGAQFAFDAKTLAELIDLLESKIEELDPA